MSPREEPIDLRDGPVALGRHVLLTQLGRGGMSVVYAAYDQSLDRRVAIKILRAGGPLRRLRLRREAQTLAQLTHPNVVRIYEICEHEQLDYLVMELVEGVTLGEWCRKYERRSRSRDASWAAILEVYLAAGRGLAAAHAKGIIHRDFKPDNAMVRASDGQVLVMDFGLAREARAPREPTNDDADARELETTPIDIDLDWLAEDSTPGDDSPHAPPTPAPSVPWSLHTPASHDRDAALTQAGAVIGTVGYMAPEQLRGKPVDARSDQWSFCAALWEALYGERPFPATSLAGYREAVLGHPIRPPARDDVPTWLRTVLERGLAREPKDRWPSMEALLEALAHDPTRGRRKRWVGLALLVGVAAVVTGTWGYEQRRTAWQLDACEAEAAEVDAIWNPDIGDALAQAFTATEHPMAASTWAATQPWLDRYAGELAQLRRRNCLASELEDTRALATASLVAACLDDREANFAALVEVLMSADAAMIQQAPEAASTLPLLRDCEDERRQAGQLRPPQQLGPELAALEARIYRATARYRIGELDPALDQAEAALRDAEALGWAPVVSNALLLVARLHAAHSRWGPAEAAARRAFHKAAVAGDSVAMIEASVAAISLATAAGHLDDAESWRETAAALIHDAGLDASLIAGEFEVAAADLALTRGDLEVAEVHVDLGLAVLEGQLGPDHPALGPALSTLSHIHSARAEYEQVRLVDERRLDVFLRAFGPDSVQLIAVYNDLGGAMQYTGAAERGLAYYHQALALAERTYGPEHPQAGKMLCNIGLYNAEYGQVDLALPYFERCLTVFERNLGPEHVRLLKPLVNVGSLSSRRGAHARALDSLQRAASILAATNDGDSDERDVWVRASYADALVRAGQPTVAHREYQRALFAAEDAYGPTHAQVIRPLIGLAEIEVEAGDLALADRRIARVEALIHMQRWRQWELDFLVDQRRYHGAVEEAEPEDERAAALASIRAHRAEFVAWGEHYSVGEIDVWLARNRLSPEPEPSD